ncbi:TetR/AcrR family transcriptional regulator [Altererythrobacter sp. MF3-039]|uniref:TetR/AcrR family transcriptional regulator n=1 Tax=Altererythrobacter sp. MF3-039 TaxID=3252901 RepID=UPI00390CC176
MSKAGTNTGKRRRFSPEKRKSLILDHTAEIVARDGVAVLTMELIAQEAGISKSLVYTYFDNLTDLLRALLKRELKAQRELQFREAEAAPSLEELVRGVTHQYLKYIAERGLIIERLQSEPTVSRGSDPTAFKRGDAVEYIAKIVASSFDLPIDLARAASDISFGIPAAAGAYLLHSEASLAEVEEITVAMILGALEALETRFSSSGE